MPILQQRVDLFKRSGPNAGFLISNRYVTLCYLAECGALSLLDAGVRQVSSKCGGRGPLHRIASMRPAAFFFLDFRVIMIPPFIAQEEIDMSRWVFYSAPGTCALATHIALHEAGADFDLVKLDFGANQQQSPEFLRINPKGRVPALVTEHGVLTETPALLAFVAQSFPAAGLAPLDDPFAFARLQELASYLASTVHVAHAHKRRGARWADDPAAEQAMRAKVPQNMTACAAFLESQIVGPWVLGERFSVADGYLYTVGGWLEGDAVDVSKFPKLGAYLARVGAREAVQRAVAEAGA